ncbi:hypothetical protein F4825DRAFT_468228 [Nemania diffusa]|nr:hypothetical protein F4825DRAFT_468228 [Nemania diffusa]
MLSFVSVSLATLALYIAGLNWAYLHFAITLQDRARSQLTDSTSAILDKCFASAMQQVIGAAAATGVFSTLFAIFGLYIALSPARQEDRKVSWKYVWRAQAALAFDLIITGAYIAFEVIDFQTSFDKFGNDNNFPYYNIMYHGSGAQAVLGSFGFGPFLFISYFRTFLMWMRM